MAEKKGAKREKSKPRIRVECFMLCDFARAENGKMDVLGGGWDRLSPRQLPFDHSIHIAAKVVVLAGQSPDELKFTLLILDGDEVPVLPEPIAISIHRAGQDALDDLRRDAAVLLPIGVEMSFHRAGPYVIALALGDGTEIARTGFVVSEPRDEAVDVANDIDPER